MNRTDLEPGFLQAFRLFIATRIVFWVVIGPILVVIAVAQGTAPALSEIISLSLVERLSLPNIAPILMLEALVLVLLMLPQAPRYLGRWFVPIILLISLVPLLVGFYWWPSENPLQTPFVIFFFVTLVLIAWQYPFRYTIAYVLALTLYEAWAVTPLTSLPLTVNASWLILQGAMMLIVGYIIVQLATIQREQRVALSRAYEKQAATTRRLQQYTATLEELAISRERNRMARELHDTLAHSLSAVAVQLEAVRSLWQVDPERAQKMLDDADQIVRQGLTDARRALQDLRASPLQDCGLLLALQELAETAAERCGATLELDLPEQVDGSVPAVVEQGVYRIAQEALENVVRHAEAGLLVLRLEQNLHSLVMVIQDDGRGGATPAGAGAMVGGRDRYGLQGMQERASVIDAHLEIASREERGTTVRLTVPLGSTSAAEGGEIG